MRSLPPRLLLLVAALTLVAVACAPSARPESYDSTTEENFIEACEISGEDLGDAVAAVCRCSYDEIVRSIPFEEFETLDDDLRSDIDTPLPAEVSAIVAECIRSTAS